MSLRVLCQGVTKTGQLKARLGTESKSVKGMERVGTMTKRESLALLVLALMAAGTASAQTMLTISGSTTNTVPVYAGSTTLGNSPLGFWGQVGIAAIRLALTR